MFMTLILGARRHRDSDSVGLDWRFCKRCLSSWCTDHALSRRLDEVIYSHPRSQNHTYPQKFQVQLPNVPLKQGTGAHSVGIPVEGVQWMII